MTSENTNDIPEQPIPVSPELTATPEDITTPPKNTNIYDGTGKLIEDNEPPLLQVEVKDKYSYQENNWKDNDVTVNIPSKTAMKELLVAAQVNDEINRGTIDKSFIVDNQEWGTTLGDAQDRLMKDNLFIEKINDPETDFEQSVHFNGKSLQMTELKSKKIENSNLKGARAKLAFSKHIGLGTIIQVPLWHSGIWVNIMTPTELDIIELNRNISKDKIELGRQTLGLSFESITVYTVDRLVSFAIDHIQSSSIAVAANQEIDFKDIIVSQDIPILVEGLASAMFPRGFQYKRACINNYKECRHVVHERINLNKLQWTDNKALSEKNKNHMADRQPNIRSLESIKEYQNDILQLAEKQFDLVDQATGSVQQVTLKTPTIKQYVEMGYKWISGITEIVEKTISTEAPIAEKNELIENYAQATLLRQYGHWIKSIGFDDNIVDDADSIEELLDVISQHDNMREEIKKRIIKYINDSTISIIGIPTYECEACAAPQSEKDSKPVFANIIPLDPINVFFNLLGQKLGLILLRV